MNAMLVGFVASHNGYLTDYSRETFMCLYQSFINNRYCVFNTAATLMHCSDLH